MRHVSGIIEIKIHVKRPLGICFQATWPRSTPGSSSASRLSLVPNYWFYHPIHKFKNFNAFFILCSTSEKAPEEGRGLDWHVFLLRKKASGWAGLSPCSGSGPWTGLAYLPAQDWPVFLLRKRVPDWTGLSPCSGIGSPTGLAFLPSPEQGPRLDWPVSLLRKRVLPLGQDWPPCPRRGTWTLQEPILCCLSQPFRAYINKNS